MWKRNALSAANIFFLEKDKSVVAKRLFPPFFLYVQVIQLLFASYLSFFFHHVRHAIPYKSQKSAWAN